MTPEEPEQPNPETQPGFTSPGSPAGSPEGSSSEATGAEGEPHQAIPEDAPSSTSEISLEDRNTAMLAHIGTLISLVTAIGGFVVPLVIYLMKKDEGPESAFVASEAKESLNFQITMLLAAMAVFVLGALTCIGFLLAFPLALYAIIMPIVVGLKAKEGISYPYPVTLRLVS